MVQRPRLAVAATSAGAAVGMPRRVAAGVVAAMGAGQDTDAGLMAATARGDEQAFRRLITRHAPRSYAIARRYLSGHADADAATQEVFWRVWQAASRWQPGAATVSTWLYRVTVNVCIDRVRSEKRRMPHAAVPDLPDVPDPAANPEEAYAARQHLAAILEGISSLPGDQRMAIVLSVQQGLSNRDIAAAMEVSEGAVEQLLVRARRTLRVIHRSMT